MTATFSDLQLEEIAKRHGLTLEQVCPPSHEQRLEELRAQLARQDVAYSIPQDVAEKYFQLAKSGAPFGVGSLTDESVDLGEFENHQRFDDYQIAEHLSWACLIVEQQKTKYRYACREYLEGEQLFAIRGTTIPDYYLLNARIYQATGWQLATVSEIIPAELFFTCHSRRFFPVTTFMRQLEQDYLQEPDIGHDVAGHVATFTIPAVAHVMRNHGQARDIVYAERDAKLANASTDEERQKISDWADELLLYAGRIYWFTVEFGLVMQDGDVRDFGAGILSSPGETIFSIDSPEPSRVLIDPANDADLLRLAVTDYLISEFQKTYFVMSSFDRLESLSPERIVWAAKRAMELPHYTWREIAPGDQVINVGRVVTGVNEKYFRLHASDSLDECQSRCAARNLDMIVAGFDEAKDYADLKLPPPLVPRSVVEWWRSRLV
jgi:phenylalanine-4-hydroxylase